MREKEFFEKKFGFLSAAGVFALFGAADAVDVPFEVAAFQQFGENQLFEGGDGAGYERYLHSSKGSFMGYTIDKKNCGKFLKQKTSINGLYLVGQYVFPGFGVAGVMASGYYLAKDLLKEENINLEHDFKEFFKQV